MKQITSRDNALYKELKQLAASASARKKAGKTILDGVHLCQAFLQHRAAPEICVVSDHCIEHAEVAEILARCEKQGAQSISLPENLYQALSQVENGIGVLFVIATPQLEMPLTLSVNAVVLDNLQDPGNLGSILRSAAGAGITQVYCSVGSASAWSPKVLRAGMGAHFLLEIFEGVNLHALLSDATIPILATSSHTKTTIYQSDLNRPVAWLFGHEGQGVDPELMAMANETVTIPQTAEIESLNVAASAAICFFEQVRQQIVAKE
ncbi:RNA methyltransferase [Undibacterium seohonense]|uniref:RNA methyltransferase n=1 Tax=Undibacterium seohonense TaxID=1344950 RepID=A0ABR6X949_9BURK|nr:RNA methyltransferase [Undibacterium seohonense]MBC3809463.1 RNA methyltransferase [Undibacterium seohonense]